MVSQFSPLTANTIARSIVFLAASTALEVAEFAISSLNDCLATGRVTSWQSQPVQPTQSTSTVATTATLEIASLPALPASESLVSFDHLPSLTIRDLKQLAREVNLKGYSRMSKAELIAALASL